MLKAGRHDRSSPPFAACLLATVTTALHIIIAPGLCPLQARTITKQRARAYGLSVSGTPEALVKGITQARGGPSRVGGSREKRRMGIGIHSTASCPVTKLLHRTRH